MSWGAQQKRTTAASAMEMARPVDWCEDTTNPSMLQEKVKNLLSVLILKAIVFQTVPACLNSCVPSSVALHEL